MLLMMVSMMIMNWMMVVMLNMYDYQDEHGIYVRNLSSELSIIWMIIIMLMPMMMPSMVVLNDNDTNESLCNKILILVFSLFLCWRRGSFLFIIIIIIIVIIFFFFCCFIIIIDSIILLLCFAVVVIVIAIVTIVVVIFFFCSSFCFWTSTSTSTSAWSAWSPPSLSPSSLLLVWFLFSYSYVTLFIIIWFWSGERRDWFCEKKTKPTTTTTVAWHWR